MPPVIGLTLNYRDPELTRRCVESLLSEEIEQVLIWDNSSDDGISASTLRKMLEDQPRITIHESPVNLGFAAGVNRGLAQIQERYPSAWVLLINNDAVLLPGSLKRLTEALVSHPDAVLAYPTIDHGGRAFGTVYYHRILALITTQALPGSFPYASGCCQLIAPERYPGELYDEDFFMYGEDVELGWRLGSSRMIYVPSAKVRHEGSATSRMGTSFYETRLVESHLRLIGKLASNRLDRGLLFLGRLLTLPVRTLVRTLRYRSLVPLKALVAGCRLANIASLSP
ncbi:hypothetical protein JCM13664_19670 [Methylothermus subterraneus]